MAVPLVNCSTALEGLECGTCGISFAVPTCWLEERRDRGAHEGRFYCPNGHCRVFRESELDRVRRDLARAKEAAAWHEHRAQEKDRQLVATRGQLTKMRNRIERGVCPDCKRSFTNLRRHMETKHP